MSSEKGWTTVTIEIPAEPVPFTSPALQVDREVIRYVTLPDGRGRVERGLPQEGE